MNVMYKKFSIILLSFILCITTAGCGNSGKYKDAKGAMDSGDYVSAVSAFSELAASNYKDSAELANEAMYRYVNQHLDNKNTFTFSYLETLVSEDYKDSLAIADELYSWKADIAINTLKQSSVHKERLNVTGLTFPFYYFNFRIYGGPPDGKYIGKYEIVFSNGQKIVDKYGGSDSNGYLSVILSGTENPRGKTVFKLYDENDNLLASKTSYIS